MYNDAEHEIYRLEAENKQLREMLGAAEKVVEAAREVAATEVVRDHCVWEWELSEALEEFDKMKTIRRF